MYHHFKELRWLDTVLKKPRCMPLWQFNILWSYMFMIRRTLCCTDKLIFLLLNPVIFSNIESVIIATHMTNSLMLLQTWQKYQVDLFKWSRSFYTSTSLLSQSNRVLHTLSRLCFTSTPSLSWSSCNASNIKLVRVFYEKGEDRFWSGCCHV